MALPSPYRTTEQIPIFIAFVNEKTGSRTRPHLEK